MNPNKTKHLLLIMTNTNIYFQDTVASPDPKAKGREQSNEVRKKCKYIQTLSFYQVLIHFITQIFISSIQLTLLTLKKKEQYRVMR